MGFADSRLGPGTLTVGGLEMACQISQVSLTPDHSEEDGLATLCNPDPAPELTTSWTLEGEGVQDWELPDGFVEFARANNGMTRPFQWVPNTGLGVRYSGECQVRAVPIGGEINTQLTTSFEWPVVGELTREDDVTGAREVVA